MCNVVTVNSQWNLKLSQLNYYNTANGEIASLHHSDISLSYSQFLLKSRGIYRLI